MEHRWSKRRPVALEVGLYRNGSELPGGAVARNISAHGVFLEKPDPDITVNTVLDVEFALGTQVSPGMYRLPALVRHVSPRGLGLMFIDSNYDLIRSFQDALHAAGASEYKPASGDGTSP